jgi:hypothetical protein
LQRLISRFQLFSSLLDLRHPGLELLQLQALRLIGLLDLLLFQEHLLKLFLRIMQLLDQQFVLFQRFLSGRFKRPIGGFQLVTSLLRLHHPGLQLLQLQAPRLFGLLDLFLLQTHALKLVLHMVQLRPYLLMILPGQ